MAIAPSQSREQPIKQVHCPICDKAMAGQGLTDWPCFPFCSTRCKTIDLGRWLKESYGVQAEEPEDAD